MGNMALAYGIHHIVWLACVLGAARGFGTLAALLCLPLLAAQMVLDRRRLSPLRWTLPVAAVGASLDSLLGLAGLIEFHSTPWPAWIAPPWLLAIWVVFAGAAPALMAWLKGRWLACAALAAVGGPLAYSGGAALGAATLPTPAVTLAVMAVLWGLLLPVLVARMPTLSSAAPPQARPGRR